MQRKIGKKIYKNLGLQYNQCRFELMLEYLPTKLSTDQFHNFSVLKSTDPEVSFSSETSIARFCGSRIVKVLDGLS